MFFFLPKHKRLGMAKSKVGKGKSGGFEFGGSLALLRGVCFLETRENGGIIATILFYP
jgi:hypothetical protein